MVDAKVSKSDANTVKIKKKFERKKNPTSPKVVINSRFNANGLSKSEVWVDSDNIYGSKESNNSFLLVGFDTEYKTPEKLVTKDDVRSGDANYEVLSYQVFCKLMDGDNENPKEWAGVCYPLGQGERLSLSDVVTFAIWKGVSTGVVKAVPDNIQLVGHFTRADLPALSNFKDMQDYLSAIRNTFTTSTSGIWIDYVFDDSTETAVRVQIRDTILLTPAQSKGLAALGDLVGVPKVSLDPDPDKAKFYIQNMDKLLEEKPDLFETYGVTDAVICVRYIERLLDLCEQILGERYVPATLTGIGLKLLLKEWADAGMDPHFLVGKEEVVQNRYDNKRGRYVKEKTLADLAAPHLHIILATEAYHGGRNEQFWFGPAFEADWIDFDLSSAYPTAMSMIRTPDWNKVRYSTKVDEFTAQTLGCACVEFSFPKSVRFPTMPVRTENGLVFPRSGTAYCGAPEIALARSLGAKIRILNGAIVPFKDDQAMFGSFIKGCLAKRKAQPKGSLEEQFWKELSNSTYGKTAQGLREKRVYDLREKGTKPLPPSEISNPFLAGYITSFVRAVLGEVMNALPADVTVFSCTTDGFLTNATKAQIAEVEKLPLCRLFSERRDALTGQASVLEIKHECRRPLGWRTRGQATLKEGTSDKGDGYNFVLAKGGIYTGPELDDVRLQNDYIVDLFLNRTPESSIKVRSSTTIRDIIELDADLVGKELERRVNMEFDWKRRPAAVHQDPDPGHLAFSTMPWETIEECQQVRDHWEAYCATGRKCLKTVDAYEAFATHVFTRSCLTGSDAAYLKSAAPDLARLRQSLCSAWNHSEAGLSYREGGMTNQKFADALAKAGIPCSRSDVENGGKKAFEPKRCPPTPAAKKALKALARVFPKLDSSALLSPSDQALDLLGAMKKKLPGDFPRAKAAGPIVAPPVGISPVLPVVQ